MSDEQFAEIEDRAAEGESTQHDVQVLMDERDALRARLAEAEALLRVVAEADNSDMSICYQLCNVSWYGGETVAEEMEMRHDAPCVVERAEAWLAQYGATALTPGNAVWTGVPASEAIRNIVREQPGDDGG